MPLKCSAKGQSSILLQQFKSCKSIGRNDRWRRLINEKEVNLKIANIFVTGGIRSGKSTVLSRVIAAFPNVKIGGFRTVPIIENGVKKGFIFESLSGESHTFAHVALDSDNQFDVYRYNIGIFDELGVKCLKDALANSDLILMDEIGMMEQGALNFRQIILSCLNSTTPVLGAFQKRASWFAHLILSRNDTAIFEVTSANRQTIPEQIIPLLNDYIAESKS